MVKAKRRQTQGVTLIKRDLSERERAKEDEAEKIKIKRNLGCGGEKGSCYHLLL